MANVFEGLFSKLDGYTSAFVAVNTKITDATSSKDKAVKDFIAESDHPDAVKYRKALAKATELLEALAVQEVGGPDLSDEELAALRTEQAFLKGKVKNVRTLITETATEMDVPEAIEQLAGVEDPTGKKGAPVGSGTGVPRASVSIKAVTGNLAGTSWPTFTAAAQKLKSDANQMRADYAAAAGVGVENLKDVTATFEIEVAGHVLEVSPKERITKATANKSTAKKDSAQADDKEITDAEMGGSEVAA